MNVTFTSLSYRDTASFSPIIVDYLDGVQALRPFFAHDPNEKGLAAALAAREKTPVNRTKLVQHLQEQYRTVQPSAAVAANIEALAQPHTFTVCTAHQPALFTGTLYFVYKILHAVRLAESLTQQHPGKKFVPVYWMGSEDADFDELGKFYLGDEKIVWPTRQTGAFGRMNTKGLDLLIHRIAGELTVLPFGNELVDLLKECYLKAPDIQTATFHLLDRLFGRYGLVVLIPDSRILKEQMIPVFEEDLFAQTASSLVEKTIDALGKEYKVQAHPRPINLFYLDGSIRNRIEQTDDGFQVVDTPLRFSSEEIRNLLHTEPEKFSPNVILRGVFQESVLPNIAFIGGGGETAYWMELKSLFSHYQVPFPALILRNSFLWVTAKWAEKIRKTPFALNDFFHTEEQLMNRLAQRNRNGQLKLSEELEQANLFYAQIRLKATAIDPSLDKHVASLEAKSLKPLQELEKKMLRAEKRKYEAERRQVQAIRKALFPGNGLQERIENFMPYYAQYGPAFIEELYRHSFALEQQFGIITEQA